jgi:hypothetical protein
VQNDLDPRTIFDLIASHGRDEMGLHYASIVGDHERIVTYWILEENWLKAIVALSSQVRSSSSVSRLESRSNILVIIT